MVCKTLFENQDKIIIERDEILTLVLVGIYEVQGSGFPQPFPRNPFAEKKALLSALLL